MYFSSNKALEQTAWDQLVIGMGLLKDREMPVGSARLLSIDVSHNRVATSGQFLLPRREKIAWFRKKDSYTLS
jgi:hypothetical protein